MQGNLRVVIYPNDHLPEHVHVIGTECEAVFELQCPKGPPSLRENYRFRKSQLQSLAAALMKQLSLLCAEWDRIHETDRY